MSLSSYFKRHLHSPISQVARASLRFSQANISASLYAFHNYKKPETSDIGQLANRDRHPFGQFPCGTKRTWCLKEHCGSENLRNRTNWNHKDRTQGHATHPRFNSTTRRLSCLYKVPWIAPISDRTWAEQSAYRDLHPSSSWGSALLSSTPNKWS